uniref:Uncharacterized protein n=1 Tax=viral metagenome TaxID=1070528 RepID=A0A6M3IEC7_9ZZZZ
MREQEIARISSIKAYTSFQLGQGSYGSYLGAKGKEVWASAKKGAFEVITAPVEVGALYLGGTLLGGVGATTPSFIGAAEPVVIPSVAQSLSSTFLVASAVSNKQNPAKSIGETLGGVAAYSVVTAPFEAVRLTTTMPRLKEAGTKLEVEQVTTSKSGLVQRDITKVVKFDVTKGLTGKKIGTVAYGIKGTEIANAKGFAEGYFQVSATETIGDITRTFTGNKLATTTFGGKTPLTVFEWIKPAAQGKEVTYGIIKGTDVYRSGRNLIYGRSSIIVGKELITPKVSKISGINIRQYSIPKYPWQPEQVFKTTTQFGAIASIGSVTSEIKIPRTRTTLVGGIPISYSYKKPVKVSITKEMFKGFEVKSTQTKMKLGEFLGAKPLTTTLKPVIRKVSAKSRPLDWSTGKSTFTKQRAKTTTKQALVQEVRVVGSPELKAISENQFTSQKTGQITALGAVPALKLATKQDQSQVQLNKQGLSYELRQLPAQDMRLVQLPKVDIKLTQLQMPITETALLPKQVQTPRTFTPLFPSTPYAPSTFETPTFAIPPIKVGGIGLPMGSGYTSWSKVKFKPKYFASLQATAFNIRGKPTKLAIVSGLGIRPIRI